MFHCKRHNSKLKTLHIIKLDREFISLGYLQAWNQSEKKILKSLLWLHFPHNNYIRKFSNAQGHVTPEWMIQFSSKSNLSKILCLSLLFARMKLIRKILKPLWYGHIVSHVETNGAICCHGKQSSNDIYSKPYAAFPPVQLCYTWNLIKIVHVALEIYIFEISLEPKANSDQSFKRNCSFPVTCFF